MKSISYYRHRRRHTFHLEIHRCKSFNHSAHAYTHKCRTHEVIAFMVLLAHTHAQPLMYLQLAGRWPIKRLIAVLREQAIRPPSDPRTMVQAGAEWA